MERRGSDGEVEGFAPKLRLLEDRADDLRLRAYDGREVVGELRIGFDEDQRIGTELEPAPRRLARPRPDLEVARPGA